MKRPFCYTTDPDKRWEHCNCKTSCVLPETTPITTTNTTIITTASTMTTTSTNTASTTPSKTCGKNFGDLEYTPKYPKVSILSATGQIKQRENFFPGSSSKDNTSTLSRDVIISPELPELRVVDGQSVKEGAIPHQAAIRHSDKGLDKEIFCGGTILSAKYVLTAAHCTYDMSSREIIVTVGHLNYHYRAALVENGFQESQVDAIIEHKGNFISICTVQLLVK